MRRARETLLLLASLFAAGAIGCDGASSSPATTGPAGAIDAGPSDAAPSDAAPDVAAPVAPRSYDVVLTTPPSTQPFQARLDLLPDLDGGTPGVVLTPLFGEPAVRAASVTDGVLSIDGELPGDGVTEPLHGVTVPLTDGGVALGTMSGTSGAAPFTATLSPDTTVPTARLTAVDDLVEAGTPLPWSTFVVTMSEPIVLSTAMLSATNLIQGDTPLPMSWTPLGQGPTGVSRFEGRILDWGKFSLSVHAALAAGVADPTGNLGAPFEGIAQVKSADAAPAQETFDEETVSFPDYARWGDTKQLGGVEGPDPACETVGCASLGPSSCGGPLSGIAGKLTPTGAPTTLVLRVREFAATADPSPIAFVARTARAGAVPITTTIAPLPLKNQGTGALPFASSWTTVTVPIPAPTGPTTIGYALVLVPSTCTSGPARQILIDLVSAI